jgi:hypothetical protein
MYGDGVTYRYGDSLSSTAGFVKVFPHNWKMGMFQEKPGSRRFVNGPELDKIFTRRMLRDNLLIYLASAFHFITMENHDGV